MDYGWSGLQKRYIHPYGNDFITDLSRFNSNVITIARVTDIILDNSNPLFYNLGEWNGIGIIQYETIDKRLQSTNGFAKPIDSSNKKFPLINELVYIIVAPNTELGNNPYSVNAYYINTINLWNHPHHNGYPNNPNALSPEQKKDYTQTQTGDVRRVNDKSTEIFLGKTFKERSNIHPLLSFEGDVIYEGRWGNSIRLGSTVTGSNNWSDIGSNGDPITIIRNGQGSQNEEGWIPVVENINNMESSLILTSTQNIHIEASSKDYTSFSGSKYEPPVSPNEYSGNQILLNSGRLVFNSNSDHILLSSVKSINLNSQECVTIDTKKIFIQSNEIYLGTEALANEPLLLGNTTVEVLKTLTEQLLSISNMLKTLQSDPVAINSPATFGEVNIKAIGISTTLQSILKELGTTPAECKLTSKRNFTL